MNSGKRSSTNSIGLGLHRGLRNSVDLRHLRHRHRKMDPLGIVDAHRPQGLEYLVTFHEFRECKNAYFPTQSDQVARLCKCTNNLRMDLAPLSPGIGTVLLGLPFPFAQHLDARAIDQLMERAISATIGDRHLQMLLTSRDRAEIGHRPIQS